MRLRFGMQVRIYWISDLESGRLGVMPRPRGGDWLKGNRGIERPQRQDCEVVQ
jgi:hypothetical protein